MRVPDLLRKPTFLGGAFVFVATQIVYLLTLTVSCPFWDSGEYIATSYILGIPHPPGTPLYVLIGRLFSLLPFFELVATRVNFLSAFASSFAAVFTYAITLEISRRMNSRGKAASGISSAGPAGSRNAGDASGGDGESADRTATAIAVFAGIVAAFFTAFSRTFWDNAIEAEVYALSNMIMGLAVWLILRWSRPADDRWRKTGMFVIIYYVLCLAMGIHLGTFLVLPAIVLFALLVDWRIFGRTWIGALITGGLLILLHPGLLPTLGYEIWVPVLGAALLASATLHRAWSPRARWAIAAALVALLGFLAVEGWLTHTWWSGGWAIALVALVVLAVLRGSRWEAAGARGLLSWCVAAAILGISTHAYLIIRAHLDPGINEADPVTFDAFWRVLTRDQYKPPNPFIERKAAFAIQFGKHFWEYARDQYSLGVRPAWIGWYLPYVLGLAGIISHGWRERRTFVLMLTVYLVTSLGLVFYLNFQEDEVRDRDYFFVASFQFFTIWIGLGAGLLLEQFRASLRPEGRTGTDRRIPADTDRIVLAAGVLLVLLPVLTLKDGWFTHDRTEFHLAEDYARNTLEPLEPNALIFTNGDNDTFPLWYIQEVRKVRTDVRVVNLSLLNTDWYLMQLRDYQPKVDLGWSDDQIQNAVAFSTFRAMYHANYPQMNRATFERFLRETGLAPYVRDLDLPLITKDVATARIIDREYETRPIYIAVTVPDLMGLESRLVMQGLVYRLTEPVEGARERLDLELTRHNLENVYQYRGILDETGQHDYRVYKNLNARRMSQNYAAAYIRVIDELIELDRTPEALATVERAAEIVPESWSIMSSLGILCLRAGSFAKGEEVFSGLIEQGYRDASTYRFLGRSQEVQQKYGEAEAAYRLAYRANPNDFDSMRDLFSYLWEVSQKKGEAVAVLEDWLNRFPSDERVRGVYLEYRDSLEYLRRGARTVPQEETP